MTTLIAFSGSLRKDSFNTRLIQALPSLAPANTTIAHFDISELPLYNQDLDADTVPDIVAALRAAVAEADGVIIATPEYNHSYSAVTKNLIDWASRPFMRGPIIGKKSMVIAVTPGPGGGVHAAQATTEVLSLLGGTVVAQVTAAAVHEKVDTATNTVTDADLAAQITQGLASF